MENKLREARRAAREDLKYMVGLYGFTDQQDKDFAYNLAIKAFLRGMKHALEIVQDEVSDNEKVAE